MVSMNDEDLATMTNIFIGQAQQLTPEEREKNKQMRQEAMSEENKEATIAQIAGLFNESDANADGALDLAEYTVFMEKMDAGMAEKGMKTPTREADTLSTMFGILDRANPESNGVTFADWSACMMAMQKAIQAKMAAQ